MFLYHYFDKTIGPFKKSTLKTDFPFIKFFLLLPCITSNVKPCENQNFAELSNLLPTHIVTLKVYSKSRVFCMYTKNSQPLHHSHREFRISQLIQLCIKYILIQTVKCLFHSGKRKCQIHTDCILHEERLAILPVNTNLIAFLSQLSDCHVVLL